jgi:hypothetical protein
LCQQAQPPKKKSKFLAALSDCDTNGTTPSSTSEPFESELARWFDYPSMEIEQSSRDVLTWLKVNGKNFPRLIMMVKDYLAIMSTSVPSEQAFSRAGATVTKRRARLGDDCISAMCELQSWNLLLSTELIAGSN